MYIDPNVIARADDRVRSNNMRLTCARAMDDEDAEHARELVPQAEYIRLHTRHVTHSVAPEKFIQRVRRFAEKMRARTLSELP